MNQNDLRDFAARSGCDVFGVADIGRFDELPAEKHPRTIFPEARSAVVLGRRIPRGALRGVEEGTNFTNYALYGDDWLDNRFTSLLTYRVGEFLENAGWEAVPLMDLPPQIPPMGISVRPGSPPPNVMPDVTDAAVRAGVGEIGFCGVLLTPQFGPRQRLQMILTDAPIDPTPLLDSAICPRDGQCKGFCPIGAITGQTELTICGRKMPIAQLELAICRQCKNGARPNRYHPSGKPDRLAAYCIRSCVDFLERSGRIANRFQTPLRQRPAWTVQREADLFRT